MICAYRHQNVYIYKTFCFTLSYDIMFINIKFTLVAKFAQLCILNVIIEMKC